MSWSRRIKWHKMELLKLSTWISKLCYTTWQEWQYKSDYCLALCKRADASTCTCCECLHLCVFTNVCLHMCVLCNGRSKCYWSRVSREQEQQKQTRSCATPRLFHESSRNFPSSWPVLAAFSSQLITSHWSSHNVSHRRLIIKTKNPFGFSHILTKNTSKYRWPVFRIRVIILRYETKLFCFGPNQCENETKITLSQHCYGEYINKLKIVICRKTEHLLYLV